MKLKRNTKKLKRKKEKLIRNFLKSLKEIRKKLKKKKSYARSHGLFLGLLCVESLVSTSYKWVPLQLNLNSKPKAKIIAFG